MDDLKKRLLANHGRTVEHNGRKWQLDCVEINARFSCDARNLSPMDTNEAKYCFTDLWRSDSEDTFKLLRKFATLDPI